MNETSVAYPHSDEASAPLPLSLASDSTPVVLDYMLCVMSFACSAAEILCVDSLHDTRGVRTRLCAGRTHPVGPRPPACSARVRARVLRRDFLHELFDAHGVLVRALAAEVLLTTIALNLIMCTFLSFSRQRHEGSLK